MKKKVLCSLVIVLILGSCAPAAITPQSIPFVIPTITFTPVAPTQTKLIIATQPPVTNTPAPTQVTGIETPTASLAEAHLSEIHMMNEAEGWAWAAVESKGAFFFLHTSDGGISWEDVTPQKNTGVPFYLDGKTAWLPTYDPSNFSDAGLLRTTDGGNTWQMLNQNMDDIFSNPYFYDYGFQDSTNGWWRAAEVGAGTAHMRYYQTKDGGVTWEPLTIDVPKELSGNYYIWTDPDGEIAICNICGAFFYFDMKRTLYSPGEWSPTELFIAKDLVGNWQKIELTGLPENIDPDSSPIQYPTFFDDGNGVLPVIIKDYVADTAQVFTYGTQDSGLTWTLESGPTLINQYSQRGAGTQFFSRLDGFLTAQDELSITHDGGKTWKPLSLPDEFNATDTVYVDRQLNFINPTTGWLVLKKRERQTSELLTSILLKTTDGGTSWAEIVPEIR